MDTVVVIEDEAAVRKIVADLLEQNGYKVLSFSDAEPALHAVNFDTIDLIITDLAMPTRGEEAILTLRSSGITAPIIVLSGALTDGEAVSLQAIGVNHVLPKPFKMKTLLDTVQWLLATR